jgi:hypothetical protein
MSPSILKRGPAYDPLPPYDLEDVEATAGEPRLTSQSEDDPPIGDPSSSNSTNDASYEASDNIKPRNGNGAVKLSERECCLIGLTYVSVIVVGIVALVWIIAHYHYLAVSGKNCSKASQ